MTDLEQQIRQMLEEEVRSAPAPHEAIGALRKTRRRQGGTVVTSLLAGTALVAASIVGLRAVRTADRGTPADQPTVTTTINGISIAHPEGWVVVDPDDAGLNGPDPTPNLPRLVLAVSPLDPGDAWGCPGLSKGSAPTFLMTLQDEPLALTGPDAAPWPVELQPMNVDAAESGCYPGWEFLRAGWSESGRTFEARLGLSPDVSDAEREAVFTAFASMTFEPATNRTMSVVLATGTAGGEEWQLIANRDAGGLSLTLQGQSFGTGAGGYDPAANELQLTSHVFGTGDLQERVVFGPVPADAIRLSLHVVGGQPDAAPVEILDVPDELDADWNAFVLVVDADRPLEVDAFDAEGNILQGTAGGLEYPEPTPSPDEVVFRGQTNGCKWTLSRSTVAPDRERFDLAAEEVSVGFVADVSSDAPPIQLASFTCTIEAIGTLVFGLLTDRVADVRFPTSGLDLHGVPDCWTADIPDGFCLFLLDGAGNDGEAIALDADGNEIGRASFP